MTYKKKFLHCIMLAVLSPLFTVSAQATSIVNLDKVPHNVVMEIAGSDETISLYPYQIWRSNKYPIKIKYETHTSPALDHNSEYAIWGDGNITLQLNRKQLNKRY